MNAALMVAIGGLLLWTALGRGTALRRWAIASLGLVVVSANVIPPVDRSSLTMGALLGLALWSAWWLEQRTPRGSGLRVASGIALGLTFAGWGTSSFAAAWWISARPQPPTNEPVPEITWGTIEALRLPTGDGLEVGAWWIEGRAGAATVVVGPGLGGRRSGFVDHARFFAERGHSVLLLTHRGHGDSEGDSVDFGWSARHDVFAAVDEARRRRPDDLLVLFGHSLGGAALLHAGAFLRDRVDGYVADSVYADLIDAGWVRVERHFSAPLSWMAIEGLRATGSWVLGEAPRKRPADALLGIPATVPVLLLFGRTDGSAPAGDWDDALRSRPQTRREVLDSRGHGALLKRTPEAFAQVWDAWWTEHLGPTPR